MWAREAFGLIIRTGGIACLFFALSGVMGLIRRVFDLDPTSEHSTATVIVSTVFYAVLAAVALMRADFFVRLAYGPGAQSREAKQ
jgi:heme/copper-type cytochrome/quinol oxidase subunit 1